MKFQFKIIIFFIPKLHIFMTKTTFLHLKFNLIQTFSFI